jgi:hypothetical protein
MQPQDSTEKRDKVREKEGRETKPSMPLEQIVDNNGKADPDVAKNGSEAAKAPGPTVEAPGSNAPIPEESPLDIAEKGGKSGS